jgi:ribonuclease BN (tRNA processing enzyme)
MKLAFLGTGAAFSMERYNGAVVVDDRLLLDAGAPLLPHMHRLGIDALAIEVIFLTHFHGDHVLGLPPFMYYRGLHPDRPLAILGPPDLESRVGALFRLAWGEDWSEHEAKMDLTYLEARSAGEVAGIPYEAVRLDHGNMACRGYRLHLDGRILAYAGDTEPTPPLDELVKDADVAITEATGPGQVPVHTSWEEAQALARRHPNTRFVFNHVYAGSLPGAAEDLSTLNL